MEQNQPEGEQIVKLSKNALKRQVKQAKRLENAAEWKNKQKELRKQRKALRKTIDILPNPDKQPIISDNFSVVSNVAIDCGFVDMMNDKELKSFASQVMRCYSLNRRFPKRFNLMLVEVDDVKMEVLKRLLPNLEKWGLSIKSESVDGIYKSHSDMIYLSADSPNILDTFGLNNTLIIGGLVDHNRFKRICIEKAEASSIPSARLPILENVSLCGSKVLTIVNVYEILLRYCEKNDWKVAVETSIPKRKMKAIDEIDKF
jgi:tRNA (guanine9-N1)-methyltransferase